MNISIEYIAALLLIAALVAMAVRRLRVPYTVGLMLTGIILAVSPFPSDDIEITKDLIFTIFLPPLIYEAAILPAIAHRSPRSMMWLFQALEFLAVIHAAVY